MTLTAAAQNGWDYKVFDDQSVYLQSGCIERLLLLRMPHKNPLPGLRLGQVFVATGLTYGTQDEGGAWYEHRQKVFEGVEFAESQLDRGFSSMPGHDGPEVIMHTNVDDFIIAFQQASKACKEPLTRLVNAFHLKHQHTGTVVDCGRTIFKDDKHIRLNKCKAALGIDRINFIMTVRDLDSTLTSEEITGYRSVLGQLLCLGHQPRPNLCAGVPLAAQKMSRATLADA